VLEEEEDLSLHAQADTDIPVIDQKYFKEVFEKHKNLLKCEAELTGDETDDKKFEDWDHDTDEQDFLKE
jgi:hypothetical protein